VDRLGTKKVFVLVHLTILAMLIVIVAITRWPGAYIQPLFAVAFGLSGAAIAVANLACTTQLFRFAPVEGRVFFLALANILLFFGPALATVITGGVLGQLGAQRSLGIFGFQVNIFHLLLVIGGVIALAALPLLRGIENVRADTSTT
jgi:MFS family permease